MAASEKSGSKAAQKKPSDDAYPYEFGGPIGAAVLTVGVPLFLYVLPATCNETYGCPIPVLLSPSSFTFEEFKRQAGWAGFGALWSLDAFLFVLAYYAINLLLWAIIPTEPVDGTEIKTGIRLKYRLNSFRSMMAVLAVAAAGTFVQGAEFPLWRFLWENQVQLLSSQLIISFLLAVFVYYRSFQFDEDEQIRNKGKRLLSANGISGNIIYDWFLGRELNPRVEIPLIGDVDIKHFMELRPGLSLWVLTNLAFVARQHWKHGYVTASILISAGLQVLYVLDSYYMEPAVLTTIDIVTDGFGFMLSMGDVCFVPFLYTQQTRYLSMHPVELHPVLAGLILVLGLAGYAIFRLSNLQKNIYKNDKTDKRVKHIETMAAGTDEHGNERRLLVGGWWGMSRHINYLGDWLLTCAYSLPTGLAGFAVQAGAEGGAGDVVVTEATRGWGMCVTYFVLVSFAALLLHRRIRDDEKCKRKYGEHWNKYCERVPYAIIPYVY